MTGKASSGVNEPAESEYDGPEPRRWRATSMTFEDRFSNDKIAEFSGNPSSPETSILLKGNLRRVRSSFTYATRPRKLAVRAIPGGHMGSKYLPLHSIFICFGNPIRQGPKQN